MLLMPARKRIASIILGGPKPPFVQKMGDDSGTGEYSLPTGAPDEPEVSMELESAAEDILRAFEKKDAKALARAILDFDTISDAQESSEGEGD